MVDLDSESCGNSAESAAKRSRYTETFPETQEETLKYWGVFDGEELPDEPPLPDEFQDSPVAPHHSEPLVVVLDIQSLCMGW